MISINNDVGRWQSALTLATKLSSQIQKTSSSSDTFNVKTALLGSTTQLNQTQTGTSGSDNYESLMQNVYGVAYKGGSTSVFQTSTSGQTQSGSSTSTTTPNDILSAVQKDAKQQTVLTTRHVQQLLAKLGAASAATQQAQQNSTQSSSQSIFNQLVDQQNQLVKQLQSQIAARADAQNTDTKDTSSNSS